jgi:hypothetical protein
MFNFKAVKSVDEPEKNPKAISNWIESIRLELS